MIKYEVINPTITGGLTTKYTSNDALSAAYDFWNNFSKILKCPVPYFYFTLRDNSQLYHFKMTYDDEINNCSIEQLDYCLEPKLRKALIMVNHTIKKIILQEQENVCYFHYCTCYNIDYYHIPVFINNIVPKICVDLLKKYQH